MTVILRYCLWKGLPLAFLALLAFGRPAAAYTVATSSAGPVNGANAMIVDILNVGAGNCIVVRLTATNEAMIFDCGTTDSGDVINKGTIAATVNDFLKGYNLTAIQISHPDQDHFNIIPLIGRAQSTSHVFVTDSTSVYSGRMRTWLTQAYAAPTVTVHRVPPITVAMGPQNHTAVFSPLGAANFSVHFIAANSGPSKNDRSIVTILNFNQHKLILTGDATGLVQNTAFNVGGALVLRPLLLLGSHHGADTHGSNNNYWLSVTSPSISVFSSGTRHNHPRYASVDTHNRHRMKNLFPISYTGGRNYILVRKKDLPPPSRSRYSEEEYPPLLPSKKPVGRRTFTIFSTSTHGSIRLISDGRGFLLETEENKPRVNLPSRPPRVKPKPRSSK